MSRMEYNKGKLIPTDYTFESLAIELGYDPEIDSYCGDNLETYCRDMCYDSGYEIVNDKIYKVDFEVERGELHELCNTQELQDGSIMFETHHYNGGAHWTELVEEKLKGADHA